jgi:ribosome-associated protein
MNDTAATGSDYTALVLETAEFLHDRKARDVLVLDLESLTTLTDFFIICTVNSTVHGRAVVRDLDEFMEEHGLRPLTRHSGIDSPWILLDYNDFIVHLFLEEGRNYYRIEKLWSDAQVLYPPPDERS